MCNAESLKSGLDAGQIDAPDEVTYEQRPLPYLNLDVRLCRSSKAGSCSGLRGRVVQISGLPRKLLCAQQGLCIISRSEVAEEHVDRALPSVV
jgi:hypothetical protein